MPNVRLSFLCVFAPFSRRKFIQIFTADFQLCYGRLHMSSPGLTRLYRALGSGRGGVGETGWKHVFFIPPHREGWKTSSVTPQNVIITQNVIRIAAKCNNIDAKRNKIFNSECNNLSMQIVITFLTYADKMFIVLYFSVRSPRSSAHGRHFLIGSKYTVGEGVGVFIVVEVLPGTQCFHLKL